MSLRDDTVAAQLAAIQTGETAVIQSALGASFDAGEGAGSGPGFTQADINAAVAAAVAPLNVQVAGLQAQDASDVAAGQAALVALQAQLDALSKKEGVEAGIIAGLQSSKDALAAVLASLSSLGPQPVPVPAS